MRSRLLRAFLAFSTLAVVWLLAAPALASEPLVTNGANASFAPPPPPPAPKVDPNASKAPLCDPRGAITFAPPPQMQELEVSLDTGLTLDDCMTSSSHDRVRDIRGGRGPVPSDASSSASDGAAVITAVVSRAYAPRELMPSSSRADSTSCWRPGFRSTVDRPPRA